MESTIGSFALFTKTMKRTWRIARHHGAQIYLAIFFFVMATLIQWPPWAGRGLFMENAWPMVFTITATIIVVTIITPLTRSTHVLASALVGMVGMFQVIATLMDGTSSIHLAFSSLWTLLILVGFRWQDIVTCSIANHVVEEGRKDAGD